MLRSQIRAARDPKVFEWGTTKTFLSKAFAWLATALRPRPALERPARRQVPGNLRYSDLDLDAPEDALQALRRAARVPPHRRHLDIPAD